MKSTGLSNRLKKCMFFGLALTLVFAIASCSKTVPFAISSVVPSAEGSVKVKRDKNNNYAIDLSVVRLVDPSRLTPTKVGYIVWVQTEKNGVQNIGQLVSSTGFMSSTQKSSLTTVTPFKPTGFFITGEDDLSAQYPGVVVLKTNNFSMK